MTKDPLKPQLWTSRSVEETLQVYADWADSYDTDVKRRGYHTPDRIAKALGKYLVGEGPILDFGCGTGVSGLALAEHGIGPLHGTDISSEMLKHAEAKGIYERLWEGTPGDPPAAPGVYRGIVATGVISLGAAPPETLDQVLQSLAPGGLLALSFNDPTLEDGLYDSHLQAALDAKTCELIERQHGPHLDDLGMGSDVIVLRAL